MQCPNCHYVRQEKDKIVPDWQCPQCSVAYAKFKALANRSVKVRLVSGQEIYFNKVKLYDLGSIRQLDALRQSAAKNLSGYSTGVGFMGSLEWVAAGSAITGLIESAIASDMAKLGMRQLIEVAHLSKRIRDTGVFVQVSSIDNIKFPDTSLWRAAILDSSNRYELIHNGGNYVFVESKGKELALIWDKVEQYEITEEVN
jgi:hypothetical protein